MKSPRLAAPVGAAKGGKPVPTAWRSRASSDCICGLRPRMKGKVDVQ